MAYRVPGATMAAVAAVALAGCSSSGHHSTAAPTAAAGAVSTTLVTAAPTSAGRPAPTSTAPATSQPAAHFTAPAGGPVPPGFGANSATFVSGSEAWVLGSAPCSHAPCTSVLRTTDRGAHWVGIPAPVDALVSPRSHPSGSAGGVAEIRFADPADGWAFGPDLWSTHDGGAHWTRVQVGPAGYQIEALAAAAGTVYAVAGPSCGSEPSTGCAPAGLYSSPVGSDAFRPVSRVSIRGVSFGGGLALHGRTGYLLGAPSVTSAAAPGPAPIYATTDGATWTAVPDPCSGERAGTSIAAVSAATAFLLCTGQGAAGSSEKYLYRTEDTGRSWILVSAKVPFAGDGGQISAGSTATVALATSSGASEIDLSSDGGASWSSPLTFADGGLGWGDFGFTDATHGMVIHAPEAVEQRVNGDNASNPQDNPAPASLLLTDDAGRTWHPVRF